MIIRNSPLRVKPYLKVIRYCKLFVRYACEAKSVRVRFAPSPTGSLHLGGFRTALYNYMFARANGGSYILRIEDTDQVRSIPGATEKLQQILEWSGLIPDEGPFAKGNYGPYIQSQRKDIYHKYAHTLLENGAAYPCFCSERRLELIRKEALRNREQPRYDNQCRHLTIAEVNEKQAKKVPHVIRFKMNSQDVYFNDLVFGTLHCNPAETEGDPVILKSDSFPTYHFANVVDDHLMEITHVLRGVEWHGSTSKHILIYKAFGWDPPQFAHLPLIINSDGTKLSKRQGDVHVEDYRNKGYFPEALYNFVTYSGGGFGAMGKTQLNTLEDLFRSFSVDRLISNSGRLDFNRLEELNRMAIEQHLTSSTMKADLFNRLRQIILTMGENKKINIVPLSDEYLENVLQQFVERITRLDQLASEQFLYIWTEPKETAELLKSANIPPDLLLSCTKGLESLTSFSKSDLLSVLRNFSNEKSIKFEYLMKIIRLATTGLKEGPPVAEVLQFLGKERSLQRLKNGYKSLTTK